MTAKVTENIFFEIYLKKTIYFLKTNRKYYIKYKVFLKNSEVWKA